VQDKFICDAMLVDLAKKLRFFGFDTVYVGDLEKEQGVRDTRGRDNALADTEIYNLALQTGRLILTKDDQFSLRDPARVILIEGHDSREYIAFLKKKIGMTLNFDQTNSRCYKCNEIIVKISKEQARGRVKEKTFENHDDFWECKKCGQIFWRGAHFKEKNGLISKFEGILDS